MAVRIRIPSALRRFAQDASYVEVPARTVQDALRGLLGQHARLTPHLLDERGQLRNFVNVYVNDADIRTLQGESTPLKDGDTLLLVPAIAGGSPLVPLGTGGMPPVEELTREELIRYSRHLLIPQVGVEGQKKLKGSSALIIGMGGLGSPISLYLAAAGVGRIGLVDFDHVDLSNLQRQVIYTVDKLGASKAEQAKTRLEAMNPNVRVDVHNVKLTSQNALGLFREYDVIIDGTDNFPTRYLVNDACVLSGKPNVYGSIFRFEGQVSVFWSQQGPCYRCLYPAPPPPGLVPSCAEGGVLGVLPGIIGSMQASEALKLLLGIGEPLIGRLLLFDALDMNFLTVKLRKNPDCLVCGTRPTVKELIDYEDFCGLSEPASTDDGRLIQPVELKRKLDRKEDVVLVDVREPFEFQIAQIPNALLLPLRELEQRANELPHDKELVLFCHHGQRSAMAANYLSQLGYARAKNLRGGIHAWAQEVDASTPQY